MKLLVWIFALLIVPLADAGQISGRITVKGKSVSKGTVATVQVPANSGKKVTCKTDKLGMYRAYVANKGKGTLSVAYKSGGTTHTLKLTIASYDKAMRYNFSITQKDGKYILKRR